jgi:hypothetical protein
MYPEDSPNSPRLTFCVAPVYGTYPASGAKYLLSPNTVSKLIVLSALRLPPPVNPKPAEIDLVDGT